MKTIWEALWRQEALVLKATTLGQLTICGRSKFQHRAGCTACIGRLASRDAFGLRDASLSVLRLPNGRPEFQAESPTCVNLLL